MGKPIGAAGWCVRGLQAWRSDVAVLASQVTNLTCLWLGGVTRWDLAAYVWVQVSQGCGAVAVRRHRLIVDVVHCSGSVRCVDQ